NGTTSAMPLYTRTFLKDETKEIRIYGIDGKDNYNITDPVSGTKLRIIGGPSTDIYTYSSTANKSIAIYDDNKNDFNTSGKIKLHLSNDSAIHAYNYTAYKFDRKGIKPGINYNVEDRVYLTLGYTVQKQQWRKSPFGYQHDLSINYSLTQTAYSAQYKGIFTQLIGKWNVGLLANYDFVRDVYYAGIGNNTVKAIEDKKFYKMRTREFNSGLSFIRPLDSSNTISFTGFYKMIKVLKDDGKFIIVNQAPIDPEVYDQHNFAGAKVEYVYEHINDKFIPTKGLKFSTSATYTNDLTAKNSYTRFTGLAGFYLPLLRSVTLAVKAGGATVTGQPVFYELNKLGGGSSLRGYLRYRFYGKTSFYNQNELRWDINIKSWLMNGKIGLLGFFDNGRVWLPAEISNEWHKGYGFGLMIAPFNKFSFTASYGMSKETNIIHLRVGKLL
ncbi:MAG TPA: BamA/TamA family outer membrane protein, partial [Chitinophagaceae bacterium]|nr:BamA/TamA family outer membrane protein [Chitinophagaceae bacterium]